jgi:predicted nucleic acid-binding protein
VIVLDTSGIIAAYNVREAEHKTCHQILTTATEPFVVSPLVLAEVDYLATKYLGVDGAVTVLTELAQLASVAHLDNEDLRDAIALLSRYVDLDIGLTDAANVVIAGRYKTTKLLTLDDHYRVVRPLHGDAFTLPPFDEETAS